MTSILVIDDDEALCRAVAETLTKAGYETRMFHDGQEALRRFEDDPTDIVLTDVFMPNLDGLEVIAMLRRISPSTCIVAMSGYDSADDIDYLKVAKAFGATSTLKKPFRSAELLKAVAACSPEDK